MAESVSRLVAFGLASALLIGGGCRSADAPEPAITERFECGLAVTNVTVVDGTGSPPQPDRTVLVHGDRIVAVRPAAAVTVGPGVRVIDGRGKFLIPGMWDMHAHLTEPALLPLLTRHGVTGVRHMYSANPLYAGRRGFTPADPDRPRVVGADQLIDGPGSPFLWNVVGVDRPAAARPAVEKVARNGNDFVKVYPSLSKPSYLAVLDAARERGLDVVGHLPPGGDDGRGERRRAAEHRTPGRGGGPNTFSAVCVRRVSGRRSVGRRRIRLTDGAVQHPPRTGRIPCSGP